MHAWHTHRPEEGMESPGTEFQMVLKHHVLLTTEPSLQLPRKEERIRYQRDKGIILEEAPKLLASSRDELYQTQTASSEWCSKSEPPPREHYTALIPLALM